MNQQFSKRYNPYNFQINKQQQLLIKHQYNKMFRQFLIMNIIFLFVITAIVIFIFYFHDKEEKKKNK